MYGQMCEAQLVERSTQVVDALLTLAAQLHVAPQEGEALKRHGGSRNYIHRMDVEGLTAKDGVRAVYLQDQSVTFGHILLRRHVEEGEAHTQAVEWVVGVSLEGLNILT